jgi:hypothetical protein
MAKHAPRHPNHGFGRLTHGEIGQSKQGPRRTKRKRDQKVTRNNAAPPANFNL